ncbi:MAG: DUF2975 domain-containing protein [Lawsonibacter sp.]|nr:DUF2975 domain-containing protein [Lawsonibacter sp.]
MERTTVQKLAQVLRVFVLITFVCNILALFILPSMVFWREEPMYLKMMWEYNPNLIVIWLKGLSKVWKYSKYTTVLAVFLVLCGICTAVIFWQAKRALDTVLEGNPFQAKNAGALHRAAVCCWIVSGTALVRLIFWLWIEKNPAPLFTYNTLFVPGFLMAGLLFQVMSALFRQAAELKEDQDLTI